jgi:hypothetical protein
MFLLIVGGYGVQVSSKNEVFSLAQQWYVGGSGSSLQTVEGGWQVFPAQTHREGSALYLLFISRRTTTAPPVATISEAS